MWELRGCMEKKARDQVEIFYRKRNKGKWDETKSEGKLVVAGGYARVCNRVGRILDTQRLTDEQLVDMEYWEKGDEFEICKARVVLRESCSGIRKRADLMKGGK